VGALPDAGFFLPAFVKTWRFERAFYRAAYHAPVALHVTHARCLDGAACDALVRLRYSRTGVDTVFVDPGAMVSVLSLLRNVPSRARHLVVTDLSFQRGEGRRVLELLREIADDGWRVRWMDHHARQWEGAPVDEMKEFAEITVDASGTHCGASLVAAADHPGDPFASRLAEVVRDHDLWLRKDPWSQGLHDAVADLGSERFVEHLVAARKVDDATLRAAAAREADRKEALIERGVARATWRRQNGAAVAATYGEVPTNETLHALIERGADVAILFKPDGFASLRSRKGMEVCHEIAQPFGGGGHPNASGLPVPVKGAGYLRYWSSKTLAPSAEAVVGAALAAAQRRVARP